MTLRQLVKMYLMEIVLEVKVAMNVATTEKTLFWVILQIRDTRCNA